MNFIVLGAGLSGLSCAVALKRGGHEVCVIEKAPEVGGLARSFRTGGYTFDLGPHFLFGPKAHDLIRRDFFRVTLNRVASTKERIFTRGKYFRFPFDPKNILVHMDRSKVPGAVGELFLRRAAAKAQLEDVGNLEDWVTQAVGRRIYDYISLGGYIEKLYGLHPTEISYEWGVQKLKFLARWRQAGLFRLAVQSLLEGRTVKNRVIHYPSAGIDHLPAGISEILTEMGGVMHLGTEATSVEPVTDGVSVKGIRNGTEHVFQGDFLISTIPITKLVGFLETALPKRIVARVRRLRYRTLLLLFLFIKGEKVLKDQCLYFTERSYLFRRITEFKHLDETMAPKGKTSLCAEMTCFDGDELHRKGEEDVLKTVLDQLVGLGLVKPENVEGYRYLKVPFAYPVYELGAAEILNEALQHLAGFPNLVSIGRQGLFFYNAMNSSILMGYDLGLRLAASARDRWAEIIRNEYARRIAKYEPRVGV